MSEIKYTEIAEFLGIDKTLDSVDKFKEHFEKDFLRVSTLTGKEDALKPIFGKAIGSAETKLKQVAKKFNAEWQGKEWEEKPLHEKTEFVLSKIVEETNKAMEEAKKSAGMGNNEKVKEWEEKYTKLSSKFNDTDGLLKSVKSEFDSFKQQKENEFKGLKLNTIKSEAMKKIKFKSGISEIERKGFESILNEKYKFDLDEKGEAFIADTSGNRIKSAKVTGTHKTIDEVLAEEAIAAKVIEMNPHANGKTIQTNPNTTIPIVGQQAARFVHPNAMA